MSKSPWDSLEKHLPPPRQQCIVCTLPREARAAIERLREKGASFGGIRAALASAAREHPEIKPIGETALRKTDLTLAERHARIGRLLDEIQVKCDAATPGPWDVWDASRTWLPALLAFARAEWERARHLLGVSELGRKCVEQRPQRSRVDAIELAPLMGVQ